MHLRVLVIDRSPPVSLRQGNALIGVEVLSRLAAHHDLTLVAPATVEEREVAAQHLRGIFRAIHLVPRNRWTPALAGSIEPGVAARLGSAPGLDLPASRALSRCIRELGVAGTYDVLHVRQLPMAGYGAAIRSSGRLLELIDSETLGAERVRPQTWRTRFRAKLAASVERRAMGRFDVVTTVADADADRLRAMGAAARVDVVPNGVDAARFRPDRNVAAAPSSLVFVGAMAYPPNVAAMRYFTDKVLPIVRRTRPDARLTIVGRDPAPMVISMASEGVEVTGEVDDVRPYLAAAGIVVAPMVSGSGIKNKVLEAMAMARPVVATPLAVEGLPVRSGENVLVADSPAGLADAILRLMADAEERARIGDGGRALVERAYTWDACAARYERIYQELAERRERSR
jgi:glycosyltransferase involved in cell wall biosynthesis